MLKAVRLLAVLGLALMVAGFVFSCFRGFEVEAGPLVLVGQSWGATIWLRMPMEWGVELTPAVRFAWYIYFGPPWPELYPGLTGIRCSWAFMAALFLVVAAGCHLRIRKKEVGRGFEIAGTGGKATVENWNDSKAQ